MAYTKQNWECGDLITADKMNHIEEGIEDASSGGGTEPLIVHSQVMTAEEMAEAELTGVVVALRLDTPTATIRQAFQSGRTVLLNQNDLWKMMIFVGTNNGIHRGMFAPDSNASVVDAWESPSSYTYLIKAISSGGDQ